MVMPNFLSNPQQEKTNECGFCCLIRKNIMSPQSSPAESKYIVESIAVRQFFKDYETALFALN